jgi:hypothetical protein
MTEPVLFFNFDNRKRHCWNHGRLRNDGSLEPCNEDHSLDPKITGEIEWLRFIHAVIAKFKPDDWNGEEIEGPFKKIMYLGREGQVTSDGIPMYAEVYADDSNKIEPTCKMFLNNADGWARFELYDESYIEVCYQAYEKVQSEYRVSN